MFIDALYPSLPDVIADRGDASIPLVLYTYGPGLAEVHELRRKIIKSGSYKNWRLNGECIFPPDDAPDRYNVLKQGDIAIMAFEGASFPTALHIDYLAGDITEDRALKDAADAVIGNQRGSMKEISLTELTVLVERVNPVENHPVRRLLVDADVIEVVQGDAQARLRVFRRTGRAMSQDELKTARQKAEDIGRLGEALIDAHFEACHAAAKIAGYEWVSDKNAVAPYDFRVLAASGEKSLLDVKSTSGEFSAPLHVSMAEIMTMAEAPEQYDLYRVYALNEQGGKLRIAEGMRDFARTLLTVMSALPAGVRVDGISIDPTRLSFGAEQALTFPEEED